MATEREKLEQLAGIFQKSGKKVSLPDEPSATRSGISTNISSRTAEEKTEERSKLESLAGFMQKNGYKVNLPAEKKQTVSTGYSKASSVLPQSTKRTEKNSPTSTSDSIWGSSNFRSGLQMPTFDSQKLTAGDVAESVGNSAFQGVFGELAHSLYSVAAGAENLFEKYLLGYDDPEELAGIFQSLRDLQAQDYDTRQEQIADTSEKSPVMEVVNNLVPDTARNVRDLLLSMATGGAWAGVKAAPAAEQLSRQIMAASQGVGAQARQYISDVMTNPQFYSVLAETIGGSYSDAIDKGATEEQALISSALSAIPNALIEVGGGTEDIIREIGSNQFKGGIRAAMQLGESALEEAGEEILQDAVSGVVEKGTWDYDRPTFTGNFDADEDAVYNLARMLESAGYAMAGTLITAGAGGAIQRGTTRILTDADRVSVGSGIKKADGGDQLLKIAAASESQEVQAQRSEIMGKLKRGQNVSAYSLGKLAESLSNDATINLVTATKRVHTADNTQRTQAMPIDNQSAEKFSAIDAEIRRYTTGAVQNANTMTAQQADSDVIEEYASRLGENGQKAFRQVAGKTGSGSFQRVKNAFQAYYNYGNWGKKLEDVSSAFSDALTSDQAYQAFSAGQNDAAASLQAQTASAVKAQGKGRLLSSSAASMVDGDTRKYLDEIGRALGVQIEIEAGERDASGNLISNGRVEGGKIYLSAASQKPIASVLNHELTHVLQERSPEQYRTYKNFVASYLDSQNSGWFESQVQRMIDGYDSIGESISREMAEDEVVSDAAERFLSDETAIKELVKENRSVAQKVLGAIRDIIRKLANIVRGDGGAESTASRLLREQEDVFRQAEKMWAKALAESAPETNKKKPAKNKKIRRQLSEYVIGDEDEYEFVHAQPDEDYQLEGREDDPGTVRSREQDIEAVGLDVGWLDRHISGAISMDESGTLEDLIDTLKKESEVLKNVKISDEQLEKIAGRVLKEYDSNLDEKEFTAAVKSAVEHIGRRGAKGYEQAFVSIYDEMVKALEQSESLDKSLWDAPDVKEIRKSIRETRLYLSDDQKRDFQNFPEYKRDHREFKLVNDPAALSVDRFYSELAENYPGYFDPDKVSARDMLDEISDWLEAVRPTVVNWYEGNIEQVAADAAADILHQVNQVKSSMPEGRLTKQMIAQQQRFAERYWKLKEQYQKKLQQADERLKLEKERRALDREKAVEKIQQLKAHNREVKKRASDRRAIAQSRAKIERVVDRLSRKLLKPTDTQNVPVELRGAVSGFLQAIDFRSYKGGEVSDTHKTQRWQDLQNVLARISREEGADGFDGTYLTVDPDAERRIRELMQAGAPANLSELSREQMLELEKLVKAVDHMVRYAGKVRLEGQMQEATVTARQIIEENAGKGKEIRQTGKTAVKLKNFFVYDLLDPTRFSDMFGDGFYKIVHNLRMAENTKISYWKQATDAFDEMISGLGYSKKDVRKMGEDEQVVRIGAREVKMSTAQIMSLYLMNKREQGRSHLYGGGIKLPDSGGRRITQYAKSYRITEQEVDAIVSKLSDKQRQLADKMQAYLSGEVAEWGNRMSRYLYGYDKFTEKNYWPISSDPNYTRAEVSLSQGEMKNASIKNLGMTKALVEKASNPVILDPAFQVFASHTTQMAAYGAYVGPLEDLNKVINWQTRHDGNWRSVREAISAAGGKGAINYLNKLIDDVNGQSRGESDPYSGLMGAAKAASIAGNLRVVVQQPTAYWRAMAVIPPQYLVKGMVGRKVNVDEMHTVAPISQWKEWGYFRDGVAGSNILELMQGKSGAREKLVDWSMSLAGKADDMTWRQIYRAVESWVAGSTDYQRGSEAFRQEVGKRFTEVVDRTQVVDSVFQRTQAMRNTGFGWKLATAFMAEPLKSYNLLVGSARNFAGAPKDKKKDALGTMLMSALGFAVSSIVNAVMQSAWDVGRDKDPDEKIVEKFMQAMFGDSINDVKKGDGTWYELVMAAVDGNLAGNFNPMSMIPVLNDIWSMLEGYDPEVMGLDAIGDILSSGKTLYKSISDGSGKYTTGYNTIQFIRKISSVTGLPIGNIYREVESLLNFPVDVAGEWLGLDTGRLEFELNKLWLRGSENTSFYYQEIMTARGKGDKQLAADIANYLLSQGVKRDSITNGLVTIIYKDEENADLIQAYAEAYIAMDYNGMVQVDNEAAARGISAAEIQKAAERYMNSLEPEEEETPEQFEASDFDAGEVEFDNSYNVSAAVVGLLAGDSSATSSATQQLLGSGKTQDEVDTSIKTELKTKMANDMGFESISQMEEAGEEFDVNSREYQILHDQYGYTQYGYSDLYDALVDGRGYDAIYDDMLGQTSSGDNKFTAEKIEDAMKERLQEDFNIRYKGGTGSGWEFYMNKLKEYGKSWDEILTRWKRSKAGKEWNDSH